jgi:hypothetical protein
MPGAALPVPPEIKSGRRDSNPGPPAPKAGALTKLRYAPLPLTYSQRRYYLTFDALLRETAHRDVATTRNAPA